MYVYSLATTHYQPFSFPLPLDFTRIEQKLSHRLRKKRGLTQQTTKNLQFKHKSKITRDLPTLMASSVLGYKSLEGFSRTQTPLPPYDILCSHVFSDLFCQSGFKIFSKLRVFNHET